MKESFFMFLLLFWITLSLSKAIESEETDDNDTGEEEVDKTIPVFSQESGFYDNEFELSLSSEDGFEIYYTTDSSNPITSSTAKKYTAPIKIYDRSSEPNVYAEIGDDENSPLFIGPLGGYKRPKYLIDKAMVVRAYCKNNEGNSKIITHTYFVTTNNLSKYQDFVTII